MTSLMPHYHSDKDNMIEGYPKTFEEANDLVESEDLPDDVLDRLREIKSRVPKRLHEEFKMFFHTAFRRLHDD